MDEDGCPEPDRDGDGIPDSLDNCPDTPNTDQMDLDMDDLGDACDPDIDGDELLNVCETAGDCPLDCRALCMELPDDFMCNGCADTDPRNPDSDAGGVPDGIEVGRGTDATVPEDDPLPGMVTGGSVFACAAVPGRDTALPMLALLGIALAFVLRRG